MAATPHLISFQGYVTDSSDKPITGDLRVTIYNSTNNSVWGPIEFIGEIKNGIFDVLLGGSTPLNLDNAQKHYIDVEVRKTGLSYEKVVDKQAFYPGGGSNEDINRRLDAIESVLNGVSCNTSLPGICAAGTIHLQNGTLRCVPNAQSSPELCNGLDDNCNNQTDEGDPGGNSSCSTGLLGVCASGTTHCQGGSLSCVQNVNASSEVCNGLDDDCDGLIDEGVCVSCTDNDHDGYGVCPNCGASKGCSFDGNDCDDANANVHPGAAEMCNGLDDDCDGTIDNGNPGGGAACSTGLLGICAAGTVQCIGGALQCIQNNQPIAELCNGLDDDCDGLIDETFNLNTDPDNCGSCGQACSANHMATRTCTNGACSGTCQPGFGDCNGNKQVDGCEAIFNIDVNNCGGCGMPCSTYGILRSCAGGSCEGGVCMFGYKDCNNNKRSDGCETQTFGSCP